MQPLIESQITSTADYVIGKELLDNGVRRCPGEPLPADSRLRQMPRRLLQLCRQRWLIPGKPSENPPKKSAGRVAKEEAGKQASAPRKPKTPVNLGKLSPEQLRELCLDYGLSIVGNGAALRKRLRLHLE